MKLDEGTTRAASRLVEAGQAWQAAKAAEREAWAELVAVMATADEAGIPRSTIATTAGIGRRTVYELLGYPNKGGK